LSRISEVLDILQLKTGYSVSNVNNGFMITVWTTKGRANLSVSHAYQMVSILPPIWDKMIYCVLLPSLLYNH